MTSIYEVEERTLARRPDFLFTEIRTDAVRAYRPSSISKRTELYAFLFGLSVGVATLIYFNQTGDLPVLGIGFSLFFLLVGFVIAFGSLMERGTIIIVSDLGLDFKNPIRRFHLPWDKVGRLEAFWARDRWKIKVSSEDGRMLFNTEFPEEEPGSLDVTDEVINGAMLAALIHTHASLESPEVKDHVWTCRKMITESSSI